MVGDGNIDLSALNTMPDPTSGYAGAFNVGRRLGGASAVSPGALQGVTGDVASLKAQLDSLPDQQRAAALAQARQNNEALAHILMGLASYPPEQRLGIAQHMARQSGLLDPNAITADDVSDQGIRAHILSAVQVEHALRGQPAAPAATPDRHGNIILGVA